ncbi:MAG: hypothetical protein ACJAZY_001355 [Spirosomataceae bacterium]|jgi:hypothetical protein
MHLEDGDDTLILRIRSYLNKMTLPPIYNITDSDEVFLNYASNRKYEVVLAVIKTSHTLVLCKNLIANTTAKVIERVYFVRVVASRAITNKLLIQ